MIGEKKGRQYPQDHASPKSESSPKPLLFTASGAAIYESGTANNAADQRQEPPNYLREKCKFWWKRIRSKDATFWQTILTGLTVAALVGYTWYTRQQWITLNKSVTDAENAFRVDERAWVELEPIKPVLFYSGPLMRNFFKYNIYPKNVGKTVAYDITVRAFRTALMSGLSLGDDPKQMKMYQERGLLGNLYGRKPKEAEAILSRRVAGVLGPSVVSTVPFDLYGGAPQVFKNETIYDFLIGRIDYRDAFSVKHWLEFCFFVDKSSGELQYCQQGNDEDHSPEISP